MAVPNIDAIEKARQRRVARADEQFLKVEWFLKEVVGKVNMTLRQRVRLATEYLKNKVVKNISRPVTKTVVARHKDFGLIQYATGAEYKAEKKKEGRKLSYQRTVVSNRSKPGEFPKADTTNLMKTIFGEVKEVSQGIYDGYVGTPLMYGLVLELEMDRSFLRRSLSEEHSTIVRVVTGPIR